MRQFFIDKSHIITDDTPAFVIAEIGHNHEGSLDKAMDLILDAKGCGFSAVKFQKRDNRALFTKAMYDSPYDNEFSYGKTYGEHREALELSITDHAALKEFAESLGLVYFATPFDFNSLKELIGINVPLIKVASADITSIPFLRAIGKTGKPVILSTGGATYAQIDDALKAIGHDNVALLHCVATYPTRAQDCNMMSIEVMRDVYPLHVIGLSDHCSGILSAIMARFLGAGIIEKHFKGSEIIRGTDAQFSLDNHKSTDMIEDLGRLDLMWGDGMKKRLKDEDGPLRKMGKGIYASREIRPGETITEKNVCIKSPSHALGADKWDEVIGRPALCCIEEEEALDWQKLGGTVNLRVAPGKLGNKAVV